MISMRHVYHKKCFTCKECCRPMDHFISCDAPDGKPSISCALDYFVFSEIIIDLVAQRYLPEK